MTRSVAELYGEHMPTTPDEAMEAIWNKPVRIRSVQIGRFGD